MRLYRAFPYDPAARSHEPGGALYAPASASNRIANPTLFAELYFCDSAAAAIAETFGRFDIWTDSLLERGRYHYALAAYDVGDDAPICNLDDARRLLSFALRPSDVVTRSRRATQAWAARIYEADRWIGIAWWSRYDSAWQSLGIWDRTFVKAVGKPEKLSLAHPALADAAAALPRCVSR